ncbi:RDD family protein [Pseudoxanthomonas sp. z9]|uniref:RDD family protein n=1 Tax=Pseudoxanthomonas sp. z9 TaxID=2584942 RepID=UPI001141A767|nr:RDD family protein [Pseudoxanthomonas sp. z9]
MEGRDTQDPYRAPAITAVPTAIAESVGEPATKVRRFFNWLIDKMVMWGVVLLAAILYSVFVDDAWLLWMETAPWWADYVVAYALILVYYTLMEGLFGVTVGKLITGTRVVDEHGQRVAVPRALLRSLCRLIPFEIFSLLLSDDANPRGWHDSLPRTRVVMRRPRPPSPPMAVAE